MKNRIKLTSLVVAALISVSSVDAYAGGLFGEGGLIRGDVGNFLDRTVERRFTTPLAQGAVTAGATVLGCKYGGLMGCSAGNSVGQGINDAFAGGPGRG